MNNFSINNKNVDLRHIPIEIPQNLINNNTNYAIERNFQNMEEENIKNNSMENDLDRVLNEINQRQNGEDLEQINYIFQEATQYAECRKKKQQSNKKSNVESEFKNEIDSQMLGKKRASDNTNELNREQLFERSFGLNINSSVRATDNNLKNSLILNSDMNSFFSSRVNPNSLIDNINIMPSKINQDVTSPIRNNDVFMGLNSNINRLNYPPVSKSLIPNNKMHLNNHPQTQNINIQNRSDNSIFSNPSNLAVKNSPQISSSTRSQGKTNSRVNDPIVDSFINIVKTFLPMSNSNNVAQSQITSNSLNMNSNEIPIQTNPIQNNHFPLTNVPNNNYASQQTQIKTLPIDNKKIDYSNPKLNDISYMTQKQMEKTNKNLPKTHQISEEINAAKQVLSNIQKNKIPQGVQISKILHHNNDHDNSESEDEKKSKMTNKQIINNQITPKNIPQLINQKKESNSLNTLLQAKKTKIYFKLFYKDNEIKLNLCIINSKLHKSVMRVEILFDNTQIQDSLDLFFLDNFGSFSLSSECEIATQLLIEQKNINNISDEITEKFMEKIKSSKVGFIQEVDDFYLIFHSKNRILENKRDFIQGSDDDKDYIFIVKISNEKKKNQLRDLANQSFNVTTKTEDDIEAKIVANNNSANSSIRNEPQEILVKEEIFYSILREVEELRKTKIISSEEKEKWLAIKEENIRNKYKIYYDNLLQNSQDKLKHIEQENKYLIEIKEKSNEDYTSLKAKSDSTDKELINLKSQIQVFSQRELKKKEEINKLAQNLKETNEQLVYSQKKIKELSSVKEKNEQSELKKLELSKKSSHKVLVDGCLIIEENNTPSGNQINNEKIKELEDQLDSYLCIICKERQRDLVFLECAHLVCCEVCIRNFLEKNTNVKPTKKAKAKKIKNETETTDNCKPLKGTFNCPVCKVANGKFLKIILS